MKIKEGFILRKCGNAEIVVPVGENTDKYRNIMVTLSGSSKILWDKLTDGCTREELIQTLLDKYDVEREVVEHDVDIFLEKLRKAELIDD